MSIPHLALELELNRTESWQENWRGDFVSTSAAALGLRQSTLYLHTSTQT